MIERPPRGLQSGEERQTFQDFLEIEIEKTTFRIPNPEAVRSMGEEAVATLTDEEARAELLRTYESLAALAEIAVARAREGSLEEAQEAYRKVAEAAPQLGILLDKKV